MMINPSVKMRFDATPTFIEIGSGSYQDMPILSGYMNSISNPKASKNDTQNENIIDSIADAMSDLNPPSHGFSNSKEKSQKNMNKAHLSTTTPAIAIKNGKHEKVLISATPSSSAGSYFFINPSLSGASNIIEAHCNTNTPSGCSSSLCSGQSSCGNNANQSHDEDSASSNSSSTHCSLTLTSIKRAHTDSLEHDENIHFHEDVNLMN